MALSLILFGMSALIMGELLLSWLCSSQSHYICFLFPQVSFLASLIDQTTSGNLPYESLIDLRCSSHQSSSSFILLQHQSSMECLAGAWSIVPSLWECSAKHARYIGDLKYNLESLRSERLKLKGLREDVSNKVKEAEEQQMKRTNQVNGWLERVKDVENETDEILQKGGQELGNKCFGSCCPKNCRSSYKIGKNVMKMIPRVTNLIEERKEFDGVADELPPPPVEELLMDNLTSLKSAMTKLKNLREDVMKRVEEAEEQHMERTNQVNGWLESVEAVGKEASQILRKGSEELGNSPTNRGSCNKLRKEVVKMVPQVSTLMEEGQFDGVAHQLTPPPVDEQPMDNDVVGFESKFKEIWESVQNNDSPVIGLEGMGGVGKTTLLKQLNNEFLKSTHAYDLVIWIVVSKPINLGKIQNAFRSKLNITDHMWEKESEDNKNSLIFSQLKKKKFVVLLDDVWEALELSEVGIPRPSIDSPGSKIVFTTRSQEVCQSMSVDKVIPVRCLPRDQAFSLFYSQLKGDILKSHPEMRGLVTDVATQCKGLPLALITVGRAMRGKTDARQWNEAKRTLEKYPSTFPGMKGVFSKLLFSYESLPNPMIKKCFEYLSLYPEDHCILVEEVIKLWLAEGLIGEYDSMYDALIQGRQIVEILKQACLLETNGRTKYVQSRREETVKMHDMIRDMALWIACEQGKKRNKICVQVAGEEDDITVTHNAMINADKMSLRGNGITLESLAGMSFCLNLSTLIIQDTMVEELPGKIFRSTKVLDLWGNYALTMLPTENGCLENLEYLNIAWTRIPLPVDLSHWKKLRFLIVDDTKIIPGKVISSLCSLELFEQLYATKKRNLVMGIANISDERKSMERGMLKELGRLECIMDIRLTLCSAAGIEILLDSPKLQRCTTTLALKKVEGVRGMLDFGTEILAKHLERLVVDCCQMSEIKLRGNNLCEVSFFYCDKIRNLSSLIYVPNLCILNVYKCKSMEELIGEEEMRRSNVGLSLFSCLTSLTLQYLPKLRSICPQSALPFPSLKFMTVHECSNLVKLPFDSNTVSTIPQELIINVMGKWWDRLEWDSQSTKDAFTLSFIMVMEWMGWVIGAHDPRCYAPFPPLKLNRPPPPPPPPSALSLLQPHLHRPQLLWPYLHHTPSSNF